MNRLYEIRKAKRLTQIDMAKHFNVQQSTISNWEKGKTEIDYETLTKLADYFGVSVDYLLGRPESPTEPLDADLRHLTTIWHSLSDTAKIKLLAYADGLKDND